MMKSSMKTWKLIINSFVNKMLTETIPIDEEIQNVINDHFWDML